MEDGNSAVSVKSVSNGEAGEIRPTNVSEDNLTCQQNSKSKDVDEIIKSQSLENMMDNEALEQPKISHPDDGCSDKADDQGTGAKDEESGSLSLEGGIPSVPKEVNGGLEVTENNELETLPMEGESESSLQVNDGENSGCDVVRRSIRNRKIADNKTGGLSKQPKPVKESATKKAKKPHPFVGTNNEQSKGISTQVESSRVIGLGGIRARKKPQRKRDKKSGYTLRIGGSSHGEATPRPSTVGTPLTCAEYAQCLGLQPAVKFKCHKCGETNFASVGMLREHQVACPGVIGGVTSEEAAACATLAASGSNLHITQKLILCSACDTYFESWDLFLHMQSVHRRHICLFCLAMFSRAERLAVHLGSAHGAAEASHPSADAFRSSRQSPCLLVCCTCERIFSDGDEFFDHSCRSGGFAAGSAENGSMSGGGNGEGHGEFSSGGKCSDNSSHSNECSSGTSVVDSLRNSNSNQGVTDADSDCTIGNVANLCQLHIRVAAKKALKRKDNVLVVIFEKGEPNSDQIMMRVESKDSWETVTHENEVKENEECSSSDKNFQEDSVIQECDSENILGDSDSVDKDGTEKSSHKSIASELKESDECTTENNAYVSDADCRPNSDTGDSSADELDKNELEEKGSKSPESVVDRNTQAVTDNSVDVDMPSDGEPEQDINMDLTLSDATEDSQSGMKEGSHLPVECGDKLEISQDLFKANMKDSPDKLEDNTYPCTESSKFNGNDYSSDSPKSMMNDFENPVLSQEKSVSMSLQTGDDEKNLEADKFVEMEEKEDEHEVTQQNGIKMSPEMTQGSNIVNDVLDDGVGIQLAGEEVSLTLLPLEKNMEDYSIQDLLKEAVKVSCFSCVYCTHAKKIAVDGKQLTFHLLAEHRFQPVVNLAVKKESENECMPETDESCVDKLSNSLQMSEDQLVKNDEALENSANNGAASKFIDILKNSLGILEKSCFNCDSYDNSDTSASKVFSKSYECFQCRFATGLHKELYIHNRKMHQKTNLLCIMCKCNFYSYSELLCHLCPGVYVPNERPNFRCCFCSTDNLPSAFRFMVHLRKRHHACDVCLEVTGDQQRLSGHVWKHKLNHLCYRCDIAYRNKPDITKHLFWKHGTESVLCKRCLQKKWPHVYHFCVPPAVFTCEECSSTFSRAVALRVHRRLHLGEAPHACPECGQHFISKRLVVRHQELKHGDPCSKAASDNLSDTENVAVDSKLSPKEIYQNGDSEAQVQSHKDSLCDTHMAEKKLDRKGTADEDKDDLSQGNETSADKKGTVNDVSGDKEDKNVSIESADKLPSAAVEKEMKTIKKVVDVMDLPPLNLSSESDDSDDDALSAQKESENNNPTINETCTDEEKQDPGTSSPQPEEEPKPVEFVDGIWDNFKTYTATLEEPKTNLEVSSESGKGAFHSEDIGLMARIIKAEHDYCFPREGPEETKEQVEEQVELNEAERTAKINSQEPDDGFDHNYCSNNAKSDGGDAPQPSEMQETSPKKHPKSPKKRKKAGSGSSSSEASDSSDSDSSSCSCGTNCSCSSSSSSSASSSSGSDSDSSVASGRGAARVSRRDRRKEGKRRRRVGNNSRQEDKPAGGGDAGIQSPVSVKDGGARVDTIISKEETPPLREVMIRESDLETDESETDEDFYDEQPRRFHSNAATALALTRVPTGNSPSTVAMEDVSLPSPATSVQSPASRPATPTTSRQWQPTLHPSTPTTSLPPPVPPPAPVVPAVPPQAPTPEPEVKNPLDHISEGCTPLIQPKKRGRKRKRPHIPSKLARKHADNDKCLSDQVHNPSPKLGKAVRRPKLETVHQPYKLTPPVQVHPIHNSAGALLNSSVIHSTVDPTTPTTVSTDGDDGLRLSKRKRVPKRFYGDSSDEDTESGSGPATSGGGVSSSGGKLTIVLNQSGKVPKRKKSSSIGQGSSVSYVQEPASRASIDGMSSLHHSIYQSRADVENRDMDTSSEREENESQNGRSEGNSEGWSGDEEQSEGPSCPLPSVSLRAASQMPGDSVGANTGSLYCYCQCPYDEVSEMIACDGKKCAIEWFHFECVGIMVPPKGKWYCPDCRKRYGSSGRTSDHLSGT